MMARPFMVAAAFACALSPSASAETCIASHYGYSGGRTASGERMKPSLMTAAHRTRSFGSLSRLPHTQAAEASPCGSMTAVHS